jgi:integrase/recombinase XerD
MWASLSERFLDSERDRGLEERSLQHLAGQLRFFERHASGTGLSPSDVTAESLRAWCLERVGSKSYATAKQVVWTVKRFFGWLTLIGECASDPSGPLRYPRWRPRRNLPVYLNVDRLSAVLRGSYNRDPYGDFALLSLIASTGLRPGDVRVLTRFDVHLDEQLVCGRVKGGWTKQTVLNDAMTAVLARHLETRTDSSDALFVTPRGHPVGPAYIRKVAKRAGERAGLEFPLTPRILRHTFATHAADRHGRTVTKALLGHSRAATTELYTHLSPSHFRPLMNRHPHNDPEERR